MMIRFPHEERKLIAGFFIAVTMGLGWKMIFA